MEERSSLEGAVDLPYGWGGQRTAYFLERKVEDNPTRVSQLRINSIYLSVPRTLFLMRVYNVRLLGSQEEVGTGAPSCGEISHHGRHYTAICACFFPVLIFEGLPRMSVQHMTIRACCRRDKGGRRTYTMWVRCEVPMAGASFGPDPGGYIHTTSSLRKWW